jgi:hypothetical protein
VGVFRGTDGGASFFSISTSPTGSNWSNPSTKVLHVLTAAPAIGADVALPWVYGVEVRP